MELAGDSGAMMPAAAACGMSASAPTLSAAVVSATFLREPVKSASFYGDGPADAGMPSRGGADGLGESPIPAPISAYTRPALAAIGPADMKGSHPLRPFVRAAAATAIVAAVAVPLIRRRRRVPTALSAASVASAPLAIAVLWPRSRVRDVAIYAAQMWAFVIIHELPYDDPERLRARLRIHYPIRIDQAIGRGRLPNSRLQDALMRRDGEATALDRVLTFAHWAWFMEPHLTLIYILIRNEGRFARAARQTAVAFDLGCAVYIALPTAPPWWAAENGYTGDDQINRRMLEVGERVWGPAWQRLFNGFDGNPWAAMPSLHFGASVLAAMLLTETDRRAGAVGWSYALGLGFALVYLGEHYVIDLIAGLGLVVAVRVLEPLAGPLAMAVSRAIQRLEAIAA